MIFIWVICLLAVAQATERGESVGCFRKVPHVQSKSSIEGCFDFCKFYRYSVFNDNTCSCENIIKENEERDKCTRKCRNDEEFFCGGDDTESFYGTGSKLPGSVRNLKVKETKGDKITIEFDPPERNSSFELTGYEITANVMRTFASNPWTISNQTWNIMSTPQPRFDLSGLLSASSYLIKIKSKNGDLDGDETNITARTRLSQPYPQPVTPKILEKSDEKAKILIKRFENENGPVTKYLVIVSTTDNGFVKTDFNVELLGSFKTAQEDGLPYYITAEIEPFREESKTFLIGDGRSFGTYYNAPVQNLNGDFKVMIGIVSELSGEKQITYSNFTHQETTATFMKTDSTESSQSFSVIFLLLACIMCGVFLISSVIYYGYLRINRARRRPRGERHEMSLQGPILELDNNGFISCEGDNNGLNFREKLVNVLSDLEPHQKISRKSLSLDIDDIMGIGNFGDVIRGQMSENSSAAQVHVISDDIDRHFQMKLLHDLQQVISTDHPNLLAFHGVCQTHDWFFIVFEDIPYTLKTFLVSQRVDQQKPNLAEGVALQFMFELTSVLEYLKCNKIVHKNLNSHNIRVKRQNGVYKILLSMFGPTLFSISDDGTKQMIDEERWYAPEALRFNKFSHVSDIYSCALIFWEISTLGATVYQTIPTADIFVRVKKGIRPEKFEFISDDLYQLMLNCWELEPTQRIHDYSMIMSQLKHFMIVPHHYLNFSAVGALPFYMPLLEIKN